VVVGTTSVKAPDMAAGETTAIDLTFKQAVGCRVVQVEAKGLAY
jgi:hypothetical protein